MKKIEMTREEQQIKEFLEYAMSVFDEQLVYDYCYLNEQWQNVIKEKVYEIFDDDYKRECFLQLDYYEDIFCFDPKENVYEICEIVVRAEKFTNAPLDVQMHFIDHRDIKRGDYEKSSLWSGLCSYFLDKKETDEMTLDSFLEKLKSTVSEVKEVKFEYKDKKLIGYIGVNQNGTDIDINITNNDELYTAEIKYGAIGYKTEYEENALNWLLRSVLYFLDQWEQK